MNNVLMGKNEAVFVLRLVLSDLLPYDWVAIKKKDDKFFVCLGTKYCWEAAYSDPGYILFKSIGGFFTLEKVERIFNKAFDL